MAARGAVAGLLLYLILEASIFGSGWYRRFLEPESLAGAIELMVADEFGRPAGPGRQVAVIGNSLLAEGFSAKAADHEAAGQYSFRNLSVPGTSPRAWYYMLRAVDPGANRFHMIVIQTELYSDEDGDAPLADGIGDLHMIDALLTPADSITFAASFLSPGLRFEALRGTLLKGYVFKRDLQALLEHPLERLRKVELFRGGHSGWVYDYQGRTEDLSGLSIDWARRSLSVPAKTPHEIEMRLRRTLLRETCPQTGEQSRYRRLWFGRLVDRYRGSATRIVFLRVPRGPVISPDSDRVNSRSTVLELAACPRVKVLDPQTFQELERPQYFWDEWHMNHVGRERFSRILANKIGGL